MAEILDVLVVGGGPVGAGLAALLMSDWSLRAPFLSVLFSSPIALPRPAADSPMLILV